MLLYHCLCRPRCSVRAARLMCRVGDWRLPQVQGRDPSVEITHEVVEESEDERFDDMSDTVPSIELPAAEMARLEEISEVTARRHAPPPRLSCHGAALSSAGSV